MIFDQTSSAIPQLVLFSLMGCFLLACEQAPKDSMVDVRELTGRQIFMSKCISCHQSDGSGLPGICPPLSTSPRLAGPQDDLVRIMLLGMKGPQMREGVTYSGIMPAWRFDLTDSQIAEVLNEIFLRWKPGVPEIFPDFIKAIRNETAEQKLFITPMELDSHPAK